MKNILDKPLQYLYYWS